MSASDQILEKLSASNRYPSINLCLLASPNHSDWNANGAVFCMPSAKTEVYAEALRLTLANFSQGGIDSLDDISTQGIENEIRRRRNEHHQTLWVIDAMEADIRTSIMLAGFKVPFIEILDYRRGGTGKLQFNFRQSAAHLYSAEVEVCGGNIAVTKEFKGVAILWL